MRSITHVGIRPSKSQPNDMAIRSTRRTPHRRVMRAAWTISKIYKCSFSHALKKAWKHEKAVSALRSLRSLNEETIQSAYLRGSIDTINASNPLSDTKLITFSSRILLEDLIERLVEVLDMLDKDADFEGDWSDYECDSRHLLKLSSDHIELRG